MSYFDEHDQRWMRQAIQLAQFAQDNGEVPVGAILVYNNQMIGQGANCPIVTCDPTAHAEIKALREGAQCLQNYRLLDTTLYVTLEPCAMCLGALIHARVKRVVFGTHDTRAGAVASVFSLGSSDKFNHKVEFEAGLFADECGSLLKEFFKARRG